MSIKVGDAVSDGTVTFLSADGLYATVEDKKGTSSVILCQYLTPPLPGIEGKGDLSKKPHLAYLDPKLEYEAGMGMRYGVSKHGWNNYRKLGPEASQHILDALKRHLNSYLIGEQMDPESKVNHLACVLNNLNFLYRLDRIHGYDTVIKNIYGETK